MLSAIFAECHFYWVSIMLSVADKPIMLFPKSLWTFLVLFHSKGDFQSNIKLQDKAASDMLTAP
jgi:hypothetical protein